MEKCSTCGSQKAADRACAFCGSFPRKTLANDGSAISLEEAVADARANLEAALGRANILIAGPTGVGKSTLINAMFGEEKVKTGQGRPVTEKIEEIKLPASPMNLFDTRGLEMEAYEETVADIRTFLDERQNLAPKERIHIAWYCISRDSTKVQDGDSAVIKLISKYNIPVIVVLTRSVQENGFEKTVKQLIPEAREVIDVLAEPVPVRGGHVIPVHGLDVLERKTGELAPEVKAAFQASLKASLEQARFRARAVVISAAAAAAGAALVPVPIADAAMIVPVQIGMITGVSAIYGVRNTKLLATSLITSAAGCMVTTTAGRAIASLIKFIPGVGTLIGDFIGAPIAGGVTLALGELYVDVLESTTRANNGTPPAPDVIAKEFKRRMDEIPSLPQMIANFTAIAGSKVEQKK